MKKQYTAPEILFEDFSMSASIATGCTTPIDTPSSGQCGVPFGNFTIFADSMDFCTIKNTAIGAPYNGMCYHNPSDTNNLFNS